MRNRLGHKKGGQQGYQNAHSRVRAPKTMGPLNPAMSFPPVGPILRKLLCQFGVWEMGEGILRPTVFLREGEGGERNLSSGAIPVVMETPAHFNRRDSFHGPSDVGFIRLVANSLYRLDVFMPPSCNTCRERKYRSLGSEKDYCGVTGMAGEVELDLLKRTVLEVSTVINNAGTPI